MTDEQTRLRREDRMREVARQLYTTTRVPAFFNTRHWLGRLTSWAMQDDVFRTNLFRFIDVLPSLKADASVVEILREHFAGQGDAPLLIRQGIKRFSRVFPASAAKLVRGGVAGVARQFIAGTDPADAMEALAWLWKKGAAHSVDLLGETVVSDREAADYARRYLELLDILKTETSGWDADTLLEQDDKGTLPRVNVSLKISSFDPHLDPTDWEGSLLRVREGIRPVITKASEVGASLCFDMEHYHLKGLTIAAFRDIVNAFPHYRHAGIALQAYLKETRGDLVALMDWARENGRTITVRLVKGAYWDFETAINRQMGWPVPVFLSKEETDRNFEELTQLLLDGGQHVRPAIATHNVRSIANAICIAEERALPKESVEFQMLYGMSDPFTAILRNMGYRVRIYSPVGELLPGMAYLVRRLLENTANQSFFRKYFGEKADLDELLKPPARSGKAGLIEPSVAGFRNEPLLDFSLEENRSRMRDALKEARGNFGAFYPLIIGGEEVETSLSYRSANPSSPEEVVGAVAKGGTAEADRAVSEARGAWESWRRTTPAERAAFLVAAAEDMRQERFHLAALEVYEVGKTWAEADADVAEAIDYLEYYARQMKRWGASQHLGDYPGEENEYHYEPRGVGVVISPWNFPLAIAAGMVSAGLVTGNCVIFKPSGLAPVTGAHLVRFFTRAGIPPGVLQFLPGPGAEVGEHLVAHPGIDFIAFTGSKEVGQRIIQLAAEMRPGQGNVKKVIAEMGGKNAIIVDETADLDEAVRGVVESALGYQGQKCSACSRVIVVADIYDLFCGRLKDAMESVRIGPPERPENFMGPVIGDVAVEKINGYIAEGMREGKALLVRSAGIGGNFIGPALFTDLKPESRLLQEEIFGPVLAVQRAADLTEAIRLANAVPYALTGGIFSRSPENILQARREFRAGTLYINRKITGALVARQPFGGIGMSGVGVKAGGPDYLPQFMYPRSISENTLRRGFAPARTRGENSHGS